MESLIESFFFDIPSSRMFTTMLSLSCRLCVLWQRNNRFNNLRRLQRVKKGKSAVECLCGIVKKNFVLQVSSKEFVFKIDTMLLETVKTLKNVRRMFHFLKNIVQSEKHCFTSFIA
jgi:hypothetical protein